MKKLLLILSMFSLAACNDPPRDDNNLWNNINNSNNSNIHEDKDGDGYSQATGDCDDTDKNVNPGMQELPGDGKDNNCDGFTDDDYDGDGFGSAVDCDDHNPNVNPRAIEICNDGIDNNCNGLIDLEESDDDGDGFSECQGDCNDNDPKISPNAVELVGDNKDNNCNGAVDEVEDPCDCERNEVGGALKNVGPNASIAAALGLCNTAVFTTPIQVTGAASYAVVSYDEMGVTPNATGWGVIRPIAPRIIDPEVDPVLPTSCQYVVLFTGEEFNPGPQDYDLDQMDLLYDCTDPVSYIDNAEPDDVEAECHDLTQVKMIIRTPPNVTSVAFDFLFLSAEYPEFVGTAYNDTFYAIMGKNTGDATHINISFDGNGKAITVNNDYFEEPPNLSQPITGTGYEGSTGSTTGWLTTKTPIEPNTVYEIIFSIHDEGDGVLDSAVIIDNFRWGFDDVEGPITVD